MMTTFLNALLLASSITTAPAITPAVDAGESPVIELPTDASFRSLAMRGQSAMQEGRWDEAAAAFEAAQQLLDEPMPELTYNKAVADYRMGRYDEAGAGFTDAIAQSRSPEMLRDSVYNLGNAAHQQVLESLQTGDAADAQGAIDQLGAAREQLAGALDHYRQAIRATEGDEDARANAELTWNLMEQLRQMQEQMEQQQQQQQQQQNQDQQQSQDEQQQEQQQNQDQQQSQDEQQQQNQQQQSQGEQQQQNQQQQSQGEQQQNQQQQSQGEQQQQQDQQQQSKGEQEQNQTREQQLESALDEIEQSKQELEDAKEQLDRELQNNPNDQRAKDMQDRIEQALDELNAMQDELEAALEREQNQGPEKEDTNGESNGESKPEDSQQDTESAGAAGTVGDEQQEMTRDEAQRLLQSVRDKERERRLKRAEAERAGTPITGKDW